MSKPTKMHRSSQFRHDSLMMVGHTSTHTYTMDIFANGWSEVSYCGAFEFCTPPVIGIKSWRLPKGVFRANRLTFY